VRSAYTALEQSGADRVLVRLAKKCLSPQADHRPANAVEVANEMSAYQESALERVESDMDRFFQLSLDLFCIAGLDGYFRRINPNFSRVLGHTEEELLSRPFLDFVHEADREDTVQQMSVLSEGQPVVQFRNRYLTASGQYITLEWMAKSIENEDIIFAVARDVTSSDR
jgi:serine/threonine-protein kinase